MKTTRSAKSQASNKSSKKTVPIVLDSATVAKILPDDLYKPVAEIVGLDVDIKEKLAQEKRKDYKKLYKGVRYLSKALRAATVDKDHEESYTGDTYVEPPSPRAPVAANPYYDFLQKPIREQVKWTSKFLPPETEKEKGLVKRADEITNQICADFAAYAKGLGGYDSPLFKQENIRKLFQIEFNTHAAKSLRINPTPMKCLPRELATLRGKAEISYEHMITNYIEWDIKAEKTPSNKLAFNRTIPKELYNRSPKNKTKEIWKPENYPQDLVSMETVWKDVLCSKSLQDFCQWMIEHPEVNRPKYLRKNQMFDVKNLKQVCLRHKYDERNNLPPIDVEKLLSKTKGRDSPLPENLKILIKELVYGTVTPN